MKQEIIITTLHKDSEGETVDVDIFCDYGSGMCWTAKADKDGTALVERLTPSRSVESSASYFGLEEDEDIWHFETGKPDWVKEVERVTLFIQEGEAIPEHSGLVKTHTAK